MRLQILLALITLSSAAEDYCIRGTQDTPSVTSLPLSNCKEWYFQDDFFNMTESILSLGHLDLTILIIWEGQTQLSFPQLYFFDFESRSFSRKSLTFKDSSESVFGQVLSRGNERIYVPWADGDLRDISRSFFESHLLSSVNNFRVIIMFDPELSNLEISNDSKLSLMRLFSLLDGTYEVNLVLAEDPGYTTTKFYNFTHHSAYLKQVFNSCSNCAEHYVRRWIVHINQVNKNFPAIRYENVSVKSVDNILTQMGFVAGQEEKYELERVTCYLLRTFADAIWDTDDYTQFDFSDWGGIHNLTEEVILTLKNDSLQFKTYNQTPVLKKPSEKLLTAPGTQYKQIKPEKKAKAPVDEFGADIFQDIKQVLELYPEESGYISDLLPERDEEYYEYKLDGSLKGIFLLHSSKENKKLLTGNHNMEDLNEEEYIIPNAVITCLGELMVITGVNVTLNVHSKDCPFRMLIVKASTKVELTRSFHMPGINLFIYSPLVKSVGSPIINLSGEDCLEDLTGGDGGNFTIYMNKYEGKPLRVISNGGKGCSRLSKIIGSEPNGVTRDVFSASDSNLSRESNIFERSRKNGKSGKITIFSTDPNYEVIGETSNGDKNDRKTWEKLADSFEAANNDFLVQLSEREKIQIFIGHVTYNNSLDGSRIIDQFYILSNYERSLGHNAEEHKMYDPFKESIPSNISSALKWLAKQSDSSKLSYSQRSGYKSSAECYPVTINNYEIECAINLVNRKVSNLSKEVAKKLSSFSVRVINCSQIDITFVSEFDIVLCNVNTLKNSHIRYPPLVDEELTCYQTRSETIACHCKRGDSNFDEITELAKNLALAILTVRHILVNPLQIVRAPLADFVPSSGNNLDALNQIFHETYTSLVQDLQIFYEEIVQPKAEMAFSETRRNLFGRSKNSFAQPGVAEALSWSLFIQTEILGGGLERFYFPKMLAELALPSSNGGSLQLFRDLKEEIIRARMTAFAFYLRIIKSHLRPEGLPAQLGDSISAILEKFSKKIKDLMVSHARELEHNWNEREINLTFVLSFTMDFQRNFSRLEAGLPDEIQGSYRRTIGKFINNQEKILGVIQSIISVAKDRKELETALPHAFELAQKTNQTFQFFDIYFELIQAFENAISEPDAYLNELYIKILQNLNSERNYLIHLRESNSEIAELKSAIETAFDLELEVYRALQTVRRVEDIRSTYRKIRNSSVGFGSNTNAIRQMYDILDDSISSFVFETVQNDFEYRIFPFYEDITPSFDPENLQASMKELEKKEKKYGKYFRHASFDPGYCNNSCQPFYVWSNRDIQRQGQDIQSLFQGDPLFLFADSKNGYPGAVKSQNFRIRFASIAEEREECVKGTGILLQPATFSYTAFRNETYLTTIENTFFEHVLGEASPNRRHDGSSLISPYTLWRIQLMNVSRDFDKAVNFVGGIELVGEGEIMDDDTDRSDYMKTSKPEEWEYEDIYLTLL